MPKFRKKPVVIEAIRYTGTKESFDEIYDWMDGDRADSANGGYSGTEYEPGPFTVITL